MSHDFDILIVGGGLVGASLAIALDAGGWRTALAEAVPVRRDLQPSYDERNLALAGASVNALTALGVWNRIGAAAHPIRRIHISRQGDFGAVRLDAARHGLDAFGAVVPARELGNGLAQRLDACRDLARFAPARLERFEVGADTVTCALTDGDGGSRQVRTRLLVGADGSASCVRAASGIDTELTDYAQTAFVCTATSQRQPDSAYERFTSSGPVALLPLGGRHVGVVLTVPTDEAERVAALDDEGFLQLLHERFGYRLGRLTRPGRRVSYPLRRVQALRLHAPRAVLIGNAAQTLHPIAAQGFNLGLRDALTLAEMLLDEERASADPGDAGLLAEYAQRRREDREGTIAMSDGLARWTAGEAPPLKLLRSLALFALDRLGPLQSALIRRGMGFRGHVPRLACAEGFVEERGRDPGSLRRAQVELPK